MRIAIVHDYLHQYGGAEKVVEKWMQMYPEAEIYTSLFTPAKFKSSPTYLLAAAEGRIHTTWLQYWIPYVIRFFKHFFWLYPIVMSFVTIRNYDVVLISSTYCGKNVRFHNCSKIIHYCHSPVRFLHNLVTDTDHKTLPKLYRAIIPVFTFWLKWMDLRAVNYLNRHDCIWFGNSNFIQATIKQAYGVEAAVIYPPTELQQFLPIERRVNLEKPFYYSFGRVSFHKRLDIAIQACLELGRSLLISGESSLQIETDKLQLLVAEYVKQHPEADDLIRFIGRTPDEERATLLQTCRAFLFPGKEDAGIAPVEALASGIPVIAYQAGGALEYVRDEINGIFFEPQTVEQLKQAILKFESRTSWDTAVIKATARPFSAEVFEAAIRKVVGE